YGYLREIWKEEKQAYKKIDQGLTLFLNHLHSTVDANRIAYLTKNDDSLHTIMKALRDEYSMSIETRRKDVLDRYMALKRFPKDEDLVLWCDKWLRIYDDLKNAKVME